MANKPLPSSIPLPMTVAQALQQNSALADLSRRLALSNARFAAVRAALPDMLRSQVQAGPIDDDGWSLLASNAAVAAKLRHLLPRLADTLREQGWPATAIRVRVRSQ